MVDIVNLHDTLDCGVTPRQIISVFRKRKKEFLGYIALSKDDSSGARYTTDLYENLDDLNDSMSLSLKKYKIYGVKVK